MATVNITVIMMVLIFDVNRGLGSGTSDHNLIQRTRTRAFVKTGSDRTKIPATEALLFCILGKPQKKIK